MKMLVYGKKGGKFPDSKSGKTVEFYKLAGYKFANYVEQKNDGVKSVGGECDMYTVIKSVFDDLPDDAESYEGGLLLDVDFDDKKKIVAFEIA